MRIIFFGRKIKKKMGKKSKNLLGVFAQVKIGLKKILSQKEMRAKAPKTLMPIPH